MHFHIQYVPNIPGALEYITKGRLASEKDAKLVCESLMRNNLSIWANPAVCYDNECPPYSQNDIILEKGY